MRYKNFKDLPKCMVVSVTKKKGGLGGAGVWEWEINYSVLVMLISFSVGSICD